jgi:mono/diheme cytochrome c family protein
MKKSAWLFFLFLLLPPFGGRPALSKTDAPDPDKGRVIFNHLCAACHGLTGKGNGPNAENLDPHPSDLTSREVSKLDDQEIREVIEKGGAAVELSAAMPPWGKTLPKEQIDHLIAYIRTLSSKSPALPRTVRFAGLPRSEEEQAECRVCHKPKGVHRAIAPNLGHEGSKLNPDWLYAFLKEPHKIRPIGFIPLTKSKMPNFQLTDEDAGALTAYLMTRRDPGIAPEGVQIRSTEGQVERGKSYFRDKFVCDGCHKIGEEGGIVGPDLSEASRRLRPEWIFRWLKNPQAIRPDSPMPNFGVSDEEARALAAYILSAGESSLPASSGTAALWAADPEKIERGETLIKEQNCTGCHTLDSYNSRERRGMVTYELLVSERN